MPRRLILTGGWLILITGRLILTGRAIMFTDRRLILTGKAIMLMTGRLILTGWRLILMTLRLILSLANIMFYIINRREWNGWERKRMGGMVGIWKYKC